MPYQGIKQNHASAKGMVIKLSVPEYHRPRMNSLTGPVAHQMLFLPAILGGG